MKLFLDKKKNTVYVNGKKIYTDQNQIYDAQCFNKDEIIIHLRKISDNLMCFNKKGRILWIAESASPNVNLPYQDFVIKDGYIHASSKMAIDCVDAKIDPETGKIIDKNYYR